MLVAALAISLSAAPSPTPPRVLVLDLRTDGSKDEAALLATEVATILARGVGLEVLSSEDLRRLADVAAGRQATGCDDDASCLAELGAAMGARYVVHGAIGTVAGSTLVQLSLFDTDQARSIVRESAEASSPDQLLTAVRAAATRLRAALVAPAPSTPINLPGIAVTAAASVCAVAAVVVGAFAYSVVTDTRLPAAGGPKPEDRQGMQTVGAIAVFGGGAAALAVGGGVAMLALGVGE